MTTKAHPKTTIRATPRKAHSAPHARMGPVHPRSVAIDALENELDADTDQPFAEGVQDALDPDLRYRMISEAAYNLFQDRGYADGYELDDWLQAEAAVEHLLLNPKGGPEVPAKE